LLMQSNQNHATHNRTTINTLEPESYNMQSNQNHLSIEPKPSHQSNQIHLSIEPEASINQSSIIYQSTQNHLSIEPEPSIQSTHNHATNNRTRIIQSTSCCKHRVAYKSWPRFSLPKCR
jgi:hypothetical protein